MVSTNDEKRLLQGKERFQVTTSPTIEDDCNDMGRPIGRRTGYLEGMRGLFTIFSFLAIFFRIFAPAIQTDIDMQGNQPAAFVTVAPAWQNGLRKGLAPLFWNSTLTPHFFIILSGRVVLQTYIERRSSIPLAGAAFRRPFRLLGLAVLGLTLATVLNVAGAFAPGASLATSLRSDLAYPAPIWNSAIEYFNSLVAFFFADYDFSYTDRAFAFIPPVGITWILPVVFQQTYTCITLAYLLPYTKLQAKIIGYLGFGLLCYWVGSWAWYSITGLLLCEFATVYSQTTPTTFPLRWSSKRGPLCHVPLWVPAMMVLSVGVLQKYLWMAIPSYRDHEYLAHTDITTGGLVRNLNSATTPFPRIDDWMVITGLLCAVELLPSLQRFFNNAFLKHVGRLSFAVIMTSGCVLASLGAFIYSIMRDQQHITGEASLLAVVFITCAPIAFLVAELTHWTVDVGIMYATRWFFGWMGKL